nr:SIS domain-containing protein [Kibdelosporangium phytohabitans]
MLDDPARLSEADSDGLLRAAAQAGAQVRSVVEIAAEIGVDRVLADVRPRALLIVTGPGLGGALADLLVALLGPACPVPVVVTDQVPGWVGPLDVVITHTEDPGDRDLAESIGRATRFGATVVVTAPQDGPVAAAGAGRALLLPPRVPVPPGFAFPRALATALLSLTTMGLLRTDMDRFADELDKEAEKGHPAHESFVNPAKSLALRLSDRVPLLWGLDPAATAVAAHARHVLAAHAGFVCDAGSYADAQTRFALHRAAVRSTSGQGIFDDPDDFVGDPTAMLRVQLLAISSGPVADAARTMAADTLPGADVLVPAEEVGADEPTRAAVLALRFELAALYLGLAAGTIGGSGRYASAGV